MSESLLAPPKLPSLQIRDADGKVSTFELDTDRLIIGRGADAGLRLDHGMVSRQHAQICREPDGQFLLKDLGSRNGTAVNGIILTQRMLAHGDQIIIGPFTLTLNIPGQDSTTTRLTRLTVTEGAAGRISTLNDVESPRVQAAHLLKLNDFAQKLLATPQPADRSLELCRLMVGPQYHGRWAAVVRLVADDTPLLICDAYQTGAASNSDPYLSRGVLRAVRHKNQAVVASNVAQQADVMMSIAPGVMTLATVACPLSSNATHFDLLYVVLPPEYGTGEWLALATMAAKQYQQAESAWSARKQAEAHAVIERDLDRARQIQMRLVPRDPQVPGLDLAIGFAPCRSVGGDYVDVMRLPTGKTFLAVADVCGKGLPAALVASSIHTMVHASVLGGMSLCGLMDNLNAYLHDMLSDETFVTMVAVLLDPATGQIEYVNAGHPYPLIISTNGQHRRLEGGDNLPLRITRDPHECLIDTLESGHLLALYTDGLTEMDTKQTGMLEMEGLARELSAICSDAHISAHTAAATLTRRLNELQSQPEPEDDRTFLLARRI